MRFSNFIAEFHYVASGANIFLPLNEQFSQRHAKHFKYFIISHAYEPVGVISFCFIRDKRKGRWRLHFQCTNLAKINRILYRSVSRVVDKDWNALKTCTDSM